MKKKNDSRSPDAAEEDFGLPGKFKEYHDHGGTQGDDRAKELEGDIGSVHAQHEDRLKKGRPDGSNTRRKY